MALRRPEGTGGKYMSELTLFYLEDCPYCHNARRALEQLRQEEPRYGEVPVTWIEESHTPELSRQYDYWYVPSVFLGKRRLYEAHPGESFEECREKLRAALETALEVP